VAGKGRQLIGNLIGKLPKHVSS